MGANTAVFSVMNAVLLRSLPVADPQRVVYLHTTGHPSNTGTIDNDQTFPYAVYDALRQQNAALSDLIAIGRLSADKVNVRIGGTPEATEGDMVSGNFFSGLGVNIVRGRGFTAEDEATHAQVMVISYNYWTRRFSRDPGVLGNNYLRQGCSFTIAGSPHRASRVRSRDNRKTSGFHCRTA